MLALNAVLACPEVLVPIELAHAAAMGAVTLRKWLAGVQLDLDANVHIMGILPTFADEREKTPKEVLDLLREVFGGMLFNTVIHTSTAIRDAVKKGVPVVLGEPRTRGAEEYQSLTQEVVDRGNQH
jgi:chromosome partitioning protein